MSMMDRTAMRAGRTAKAEVGGPVMRLQRQCACGAKTSNLASDCADCSKKKLLGAQAKLEIGAADDRYEREADRVAEQVLAGEARAAPSATPVQVQRIAAGAGAGGSHSLGEAPAVVQRVIQAPGRALEPSTRSFFESRFGHDFSRVRVHDDTEASRSAAAVAARAYTVGHNLVFAKGQYGPGSAAGRRLIAHELTHVLQQTGALQRAALSAAMPYGDKEEEAASGGYGSAAPASGTGVLQRAPGLGMQDDELAGPWPEKEEAQRIRAEHQAELDCRARTPTDPAECEPARALTWADFTAAPPASSRFSALTWSGLRERSMNTADRQCGGQLLAGRGVQGWFDPSRSWVKPLFSGAASDATNGCARLIGNCERHFDGLASNQTGTYSPTAAAGPACAASPVMAAATATNRAECTTVLGPACTARAVAESARLLNHEDWHFRLSCAVAKKANALLSATTDFDAVLRGARTALAAQQTAYDAQTDHGCNAAAQSTWQTAITAGLPAVTIAAQAAPRQRRRR